MLLDLFNREVTVFIEDNIDIITSNLGIALNTAIVKLNEHLFDGLMREFVKFQGFTQISSALANKRHVFWYKLLTSADFVTSFGTNSDLLVRHALFGLDLHPQEVKGSASYGNCYGQWQGGKKYAQFPGKRLFYLSGEIYDKDRLCLKKLRVVVAYVASNQFKIHKNDHKTNRTTLSYNNLLAEDIVAEYEINYSGQSKLFTQSI